MYFLCLFSYNPHSNGRNKQPNYIRVTYIVRINYFYSFGRFLFRYIYNILGKVLNKMYKFRFLHVLKYLQSLCLKTRPENGIQFNVRECMGENYTGTKQNYFIMKNKCYKLRRDITVFQKQTELVQVVSVQWLADNRYLWMLTINN